MVIMAEQHGVDVAERVGCESRSAGFAKRVDGRFVARAGGVEGRIRDEAKAGDVENGGRPTDVSRDESKVSHAAKSASQREGPARC